jgi:long-subunit acyl-CoA synthetase (AMP-forming)
MAGPATSAPDLDQLVDRLGELPDCRLLRYERGKLVSVSYPELQADVRRAAAELAAAGVESRMRVGLLGENSYEWIVCDLALLSLGAITITFPTEEYKDLSSERLQEEFALHALLLSRRERERREDAAHPWSGTIAVSGIGVEPLSGDELAENPRLPEDVFTMSFSSGTSGRLKCILLGKRGTEDLVEAYNASFPFRPDDAILIVLPLSAFQQRLMIYAAVWHGFDMHLVSLPQLMRGLREMQPTILAGPPAFYEVLENRFRNLPAGKRRLLLAAGQALQLLPRPLRERLARRVFAPFYDAYGGRMRLMLSGSAPSRLSTLRLYRLLCMPLVQAYGLTETGFISWNLPWRNRIGSVGQLVFPGTVTLREDGEIVVRYANQQSPGYFRVAAEEEAKTFLPDGSIATGDIGRFDDDGFLYIVGRKKEILITRGGYKLQPEPIEEALSELEMVDRAVVVGGDELPTLAAIVALRVGASERDEEEIKELFARINKGLPRAGRIDRILLTHEEFSAESGLLTRNLKIDRRAVVERFAAELGGVEAKQHA